MMSLEVVGVLSGFKAKSSTYQLVLKFPYLIKHLKKPQPLFVEKAFFLAAALFHILFNYRGKHYMLV